MEIYFTRHGESEANRLRVISNRGDQHGLTAIGRRQAANLASQLADKGITRIYASPLLRAVQTAEILARTLGLSFVTVDALREYDCGIIEGQSDAASWELYDALWLDWKEHGRWERRIEGGESYLDIQSRFLPFIEQLLDQHMDSSEAMVLVGHGGTFRCMLPLVLQNVDLDYAAAHPLGCTRYVLATATPAGLVCHSWAGTDLDAVQRSRREPGEADP